MHSGCKSVRKQHCPYSCSRACSMQRLLGAPQHCLLPALQCLTSSLALFCSDSSCLAATCVPIHSAKKTWKGSNKTECHLDLWSSGQAHFHMHMGQMSPRLCTNVTTTLYNTPTCASTFLDACDLPRDQMVAKGVTGRRME